jgi:protein-tyrosine-phosphatase
VDGSAGVAPSPFAAALAYAARGWPVVVLHTPQANGRCSCPLSKGRVVARSAGTHPRSLHPLASAAMAEAGVDIAYQRAKDLPALEGIAADVVVTVCDLAREECPSWQPGATHLHWSIPDPARAQGSEAEQLAVFRSVRDTLLERVGSLLALLPTLASVPVSEKGPTETKKQRA